MTGLPMIDRDVRHELSQDLRRLVTGRMTNDEFDEAFCERYAQSADVAIREISRFGAGLYSSNALLPYRLRGPHAVDSRTRRKCAYAVLFLQTNLEYAYPETPESFVDLMMGCAWFNGGLVGIGFLLMALLGFVGRDIAVVGGCVMVGVAILGICYGIRWFQQRTFRRFLHAFNSAGDDSVWPFTGTESDQKARRRET